MKEGTGRAGYSYRSDSRGSRAAARRAGKTPAKRPMAVSIPTVPRAIGRGSFGLEIFGRMWQARKDDRRGIGLGLTIAKSIVEAHGERIGVESRVGEGTRFWFTTPVAR